MSDAPKSPNSPGFSKLRELLQALLPKKEEEKEKAEIKEPGGQEELLSFALQTYKKLQEKGSQAGTPSGEQEELENVLKNALKNALFELILDEAKKALST